MHEMEVALQTGTPASAGPPRMTLCFRRTALGDQQVRRNETRLPLHIARLLLLFEGPQTVDDLKQMIDEPWLPEALIELERRRLIERITPPIVAPFSTTITAITAPVASVGPVASATSITSNASDPEAPDEAARLAHRRARIRILFLRQLGALGSDMARRIDECRSEAELAELMPQVDALIEAIAGREALGEFRALATRSH